MIVRKTVLWLLLSLSLSTMAQNTSQKLSTQSSNNSKPTDSQTKEEIRASFAPSYKDTLRMRYYLVDDLVGNKTTTNPDTLPLNFQNNTFSERLNTIASSHTGSFGSAFQSKIFTDQTHYSPFIFLRSYENWLIDPSKFIYLNTTKPYSNLKYLTTSGNDVSQEENFSCYFSANVNQYLNLGLSYEILYARGFYDRSASRGKLANIFGNYQNPHYEAFWKASFNYLESMENGGITDDRYITDPLLMSGGLREYESLSIPVNLSDDRSYVKNTQLFFNQKYNLGFERVDPNDSLQKTFVPVTRFFHTLLMDLSQRAYYSDAVNLTYYDSTAYISNDYTADTAALLQIKNTVGISLMEGFNKWAKTGLSLFLQHDFRRYTRLSPTVPLKDTSNLYSGLYHLNKNLLWTGGELSKKEGTVLTYNAQFKLCVIGDYIGDFDLNGQLKTNLKLWKHSVSLQAGGYIKNNHPDYFLEHYYSNHFSWGRSFNNEYKTRIYRTLDIPALGFNFSATVENLTNTLYFNNQAVPDQYVGNIQVISANWKQHLRSGLLNWDNNIVYQLSSNQTVIPLPEITVYSNLYLKGLISQVMTTQVGVDCWYHSSYYAPAYMPATSQFYTQQSVKVGNYPFMNLYANFHLKRMRFFVMYAHISRYFANPYYFSSPHYPLDPAILKAGLSWNFYD